MIDLRRLRLKLPDIVLPNHDVAHDEINVLARHQSSGAAPVMQRIPFTTLPAEIRNHIYELALPSKEVELVVASPFLDDLMALGIQPAITRTSKQLRSETLPMFYTNATFVAYIKGFDFSHLVRWAKNITSSPSPPKILVHVKLLDRISCVYQLRDLVRAWRHLDTSTVHLKIHNSYTPGARLVYRNMTLDQRALVAKAVNAAETLRATSDWTEAGVFRACFELSDAADNRFVYGETKCASEACVWGGRHPRRRGGVEGNRDYVGFGGGLGMLWDFGYAPPKPMGRDDPWARFLELDI